MPLLPLVPQARVLAQSFIKHHRGATFAIFVSDGFTLERQRGDISLLSSNDVGLSTEDIDRLPKTYSGRELLLAIRPWLIRHQLSAGAHCVMYFEPTIEVFALMNTATDLVSTGQTVLATRCASAQAADRIPNENEWSLAEPGFAALGEKSADFLQWRSAEVRADLNAQRPLDRTLFDRVPSDIRTHVLDGAGWNVGYWNLLDRQLNAVRYSYDVEGEPLRFSNFSGYKVDKPHLLSKHQEHNPRVRLSESPAVANLCREYRAKSTGGCHCRSLGAVAPRPLHHRIVVLGGG